jgi:hypothetical protein
VFQGGLEEFRATSGKVVKPDDFVPKRQQTVGKIAPDKPSSACDEDVKLRHVTRKSVQQGKNRSRSGPNIQRSRFRRRQEKGVDDGQILGLAPLQFVRQSGCSRELGGAPLRVNKMRHGA